jgi:multiple sugar transport system substrate-binding protein
MTDSSFNRRKFLETSAGAAAVAGLGSGSALFSPAVHAQSVAFKPEKGATLRVLRWSRFVQGDIDAYMANVKSFTDKTGIAVRVDNEGWEDVRPKAAVAANTGAGPDIILSTNDDANLYPEKLLDVTDLCEYLGKKYGGWFPASQAFLRPDGKKWIGVPLGAAGSMMVYRESVVKAADFNSIPKNTDDFIKLLKGSTPRARPAEWRSATPPATAAGPTG